MTSNTEITTIIDYLSVPKAKTIMDEILFVSQDKWECHFPKNSGIFTALQQGTTVHLNRVKTERVPIEFKCYPHLFVSLMSVIQTYILPFKLGNAYIHKLLPGEEIIRHKDIVIIEESKLLHRFQIYLNVPEKMEIEIDNQRVKNPQKFSYTVVDFALSKTHYYKNNSDEVFFIIVFDQCKY